MADIDVERKSRGPSIWPWVVALAAIILVVWIWAAGTGPDEEYPEQTAAERAVAPGAAGTSGTAGGAISTYAEFADRDPGDRLEMGREHEYTAEGIRRLAAALEDLVAQKPQSDARERLERFREIANRIEKDPTSGAHAELVREAFTSATDVIQSVGGAGAGDNLRSTAESLTPDQPLLEQRDKVRRFFSESADAIERAARG